MSKEENKKDFLARYGSAKHIDQLLNDNTFHDKEFVLNNPMVTAEHHGKLFDIDGPISNKEAVARSEYLPRNMRHGIMTHPHIQVRAAFARRPDITDAEFQHLKHDSHPAVIQHMADWRFRPFAQEKLTNERISDIVKNGPDFARQVVAKQRDLPSEHVYDIIGHGDKTKGSGDIAAIAEVAQHNINLNPDHLKTLSEHPDFRVRGRLAMNREIPDHIRTKLLNDENDTVKQFAKAYQ